MPKLQTLKKRAEFLAAASGLKHVRPQLLLQVRRRGGDSIGVGYTASKKVGNAVVRSRAKRRLRAVAQDVLPSYARVGCDYVLIARSGTPTCDFDDLRSALRGACVQLHDRLDRA